MNSNTPVILSLALTFPSLAPAAVDFVKDVQPILEFNCVRCHSPNSTAVEKDSTVPVLVTKEKAVRGKIVVPGQPEKSKLYTTTIVPDDDDKLMPPLDEIKKGSSARLTKEETEVLKTWIADGAKWPDGVTLTARKKEKALDSEAESLVVAEISKRVAETTREKTEAEMKPYTSAILGTDVSFDMVPIPGGKFQMGSPENEKGRQPDEGPVKEVQLDPFWMGKCEVTWNEFQLFMYPEEERKARAPKNLPAELNKLTDAVSHPTQPYVEMSFGMGTDNFPAISMTQHAANKYCEWLSAKTGHFYRLPTEAEWEYAARAGTTTAYFFADDPHFVQPGKAPAIVKELVGTAQYQKKNKQEWLPAAVGLKLDAGDKFRTAEKSRAVLEVAYRPDSTVGEKHEVTVREPDYLGEFAWYGVNSDFKYQKVGKKKPNPWGLHDILGNVAEWCIDQYDPGYYKSMPAANPWNKATKPYPHVARGGSWDDEDPAKLRAAVRRGSSAEWKRQDPQLPKSIWYHTDAQFLGFRIVRPLKVPAPAEMQAYWNSGVEKDDARLNKAD